MYLEPRTAGRVPPTQRRTDDGTLLAALVAWDSDPDSDADLDVWRSALASWPGGSRQGAVRLGRPRGLHRGWTRGHHYGWRNHNAKVVVIKTKHHHYD
jgi:hypothetical protein